MEYKIHFFDNLGSTNDKAKEIARDASEGTVIVAEEQSKGRGRSSNSWYSSKGKSILMSIILKPDICHDDIQKMVLIAATSINLALRDIDVESKIKWPNDIVVEGKKLAGILVETNFNFQRLNYVIVGIGINVNEDSEDLAKEIREKGISIKMIKKTSIDKEELIEKLLHKFKELYTSFKNTGDMDHVLKTYRENSAVTDKNIQIIQGNNIRQGIARGINIKGELLVEFPQGLEYINTGQVSLRGLEGYIK